MDRRAMGGGDDQSRVSYILIPGAGGMAWYWHRVIPLLEKGGGDAIAVDLPGDDASAGLERYADIVVETIGQRPDVILVAQSLGGFTAPLVSRRIPIQMLVLVNAMTPRPRETAGQWWDNTGATAARAAAARAGGYSVEFDVQTYFLHDVPAAVLRESPQYREQTDTVFGQPCEFDNWPRVPIHVVASAGDRFFPLDFQKRVARERLSADVEVLPGGHLVALSQPEELAKHLLSLRRELKQGR